MSTNTNWIDPRVTPPKNGQNCFFRCANDNKVYIGFFEVPGDPNGCPEYIGEFWTGTIYNGTGKFFGAARGIGFHVWAGNQHEISHYIPIVVPEFTE